MNKQGYFYTVILIALSLVSSAFSMVRQGRLSIVNDSQIPFSIKYDYNNEHKKIERLAQGQREELGEINRIFNLQIKPYGEWTKWVAQWTRYKSEYDEKKLAECKKSPNMDHILHIKTPAMFPYIATRLPKIVKNWEISVEKAELGRAELPQQAPENPVEFFGQRNLVDEPRKALNLGPDYGVGDVNAAVAGKRQEIERTFVDGPAKARLLQFLGTVDKYAKKPLLMQKDIPSEQVKAREKILLEWKSFLEPLRVESGKAIACGILAGQIPQIENNDQYLNAVIDLMWYFYKLTVEKGQAYSEGTFVIEDTGFGFYNFLMRYVRRVNPEVRDLLVADPASKLSKNAFAYSRLSSHFHLEQNIYRHYGIDIRFLSVSPGIFGYPQAEGLLPNDNSHILFGKLGDNKIFIKFEEAGIYARELPTHAWELVLAQVRKPYIRNFYTNYLSQEFSNYIQYYIGIDDDPNYRKERIPLDFLERCRAILLPEGQEPNKQVKDLMLNFSTQGMQHLDNIVNDPPPAVATNLTQDQQEALRKYLDQLAQEYDNINFRYGREVILRDQELREKCQQQP